MTAEVTFDTATRTVIVYDMDNADLDEMHAAWVAAAHIVEMDGTPSPWQFEGTERVRYNSVYVNFRQL